MTPEERNLITELFDRLATLEDAQRDPDAERAIRDGLRQAPNAAYTLVQTVLVQDEALKRADARIRELGAALGAGSEPPRPVGFLDNMRGALFGSGGPSRAGSVPTVRPRDVPTGAPPGFSAGAQAMGPQPVSGSFLGTAAAAAAGVVGGSLLLGGIRSMMGHGHDGFGAASPAAAAPVDPATPWGNSAGGNLARDAGIDDIGRAPAGRDDGGHGLFDTTADDVANVDAEDGQDFDDGGDFGGDGDGP